MQESQNDLIKPIDPKNPNIEIPGERMYANMHKWFTNNLPQSLYWNHYQLADETMFTPTQWRKYLKMNEQFVSSEIAAITEASARSALQRIADGKLRQGEANAIKQLLDRSEQINANNKNKETILLHFIPPKEVPSNDFSHAKAVSESDLPNM